MNAVTVRSATSLVVEPLVLRRAMWPKVMTDRGPSFRPVPGSWYAHVEKRGYGASVVLPIVACPKCSKHFFLVHTAPASEAFTRMTGTPVPVTHRISPVGEVKVLATGRREEGDVECPHCGMHRHLYLDQWNKLRPLYCIAYIEGGQPPVQFAYSHASSRKEALFHFGGRKVQVIDVGRAVGMLFDEVRKTFQAEATSRLVTKGDV